MICNVDKIYVTHHLPLVERKGKLKTFFDNYKIPVEWIESFLPNEVQEKYNEFVGPVVFNPYLPMVQQNQYVYYKGAGKKVTISELSLYLKHKQCYEDQLKNNYQNIIIFEDDFMPRNDMINFLNHNLYEFANDNEFGVHMDMLMLGTAFNFMSLHTRPTKYIHYGKNQLTRCTHAYALNISGTKKIIENLYPVNLPIDFKLNEIIIKENLNVAWSEPGIHQNPAYTSAIIK